MLRGGNHEVEDRLEQAVEAIETRRWFQPQVALILGSGLGGLADRIAHRSIIPYAEIPGMPCPRVDGHAGNLVLGYLGAMPVVVFQGRCHRYEGYGNRDLGFVAHLAHRLGASLLIATNAAGGLNERFRPGDIMVIDSHVDWLWPRPANGGRAMVSPQGSGGSLPAFLPVDRQIATRAQPRTPCYCPDLIKSAHHFALRLAMRLQQGTYLATLGPTYETRAEYRMFRTLGADAVGMSTVPEVVAAHALGMRVAAFSIITNVPTYRPGEGTDHTEVVDWAHRAGPHLGELLMRMLDNLAGQPD
ncbi:MAG: purine nucleoside phosphorylase [Pirellulaceae bacterium]|nr:MAG: purine nucleoside phosphorylase [Pirellulaceae bacterium]